MVERERIRNMSLSSDARTSIIVVNVPEPQEGQVVVIVLDAKFPVQLIEVDRTIGGAGGCDLLFETDGLEITFEDSQSPGVGIPCTEPTLVNSQVVTGDDIVDEGQTLEMLIHNLGSGPTDLVVQITMRRTD